MVTRRVLILLVAVALGVALAWQWTRTTHPALIRPRASSAAISSRGLPSAGVDGASSPTAAAAKLRAGGEYIAGGPGRTGPGGAAAVVEDRITLADGLNAPGGTVQQDLRIIETVLDAWRSNFPHDGNPVGENVEITAALLGKNKLQLALIAPDNPAINSRGELCDRWGTPILFHQISGEQMELRSAGPDRKFGTADDVDLVP